MSYTTLDHVREHDSNHVLASPETLRQLTGVPTGFRLAGMILLRARRGTIRFDLPDGRRVLFDRGQKGPNAVVEVHSFNFAKRAIAGGDVGFAESYMDQEWSTPDLTSVLEFFSENFESAVRLTKGGMMVRIANLIRHLFNRNSKAGSKRNIEAHYDIGNAFYELWLDPSMTYSSALYTDESFSLEQAQAAKYARIADELRLADGKSVLEIGCGWGGFAEYAAKHRGANVTCLTISPSQHDWAMKRMQREGLNEKVDIRLEDYRDHRGSYDGVASIEMFEAVGENYWPSYFAKVSDCLHADAKAALQIITIDDQLFPGYRKRADFIQRYIFPGGMLPSEQALRQQVMAAGLGLEKTHYFGTDYAKTLRHWAKAFEEKWGQIAALGFDEGFRRMWRFYLSYCEAGFDNGRINVGHFTLTKC